MLGDHPRRYLAMHGDMSSVSDSDWWNHFSDPSVIAPDLLLLTHPLNLEGVAVVGDERDAVHQPVSAAR